MLLHYYNNHITLAPDGSPVLVGRKDTNQIVIKHPRVSRCHGRFFFENEAFWYQDESNNGSLVTIEGRSQRKLNKEALMLEGRGTVHLGDEQCPMILFDLETTENTMPLDSPSDSGEVNGDISEIYQTAIQAYRNKQYDQAYDAFQQVLNTRPEAVRAYLYQAVCAEATSHFEEAQRHIEVYLTNRPHDVEANVLAGKFYKKKGRYKQAAQRLKQAYTLSYGDPEIGQLLVELDREAPLQSISTTAYLGSNSRGDAQSPHFSLNFNPACHASGVKVILKRLEEAYESVAEQTGIHPEKKVPVRLVSDRLEFNGNEKAWGKAQADEIILLVLDETLFSMPFLVRMIRHEYLHYALESLCGGSGWIPWWLHEGLAEFVSTGTPAEPEEILSEHLQGDLAAMVELISQPTLTIEEADLNALLRELAVSLVSFLHERGGDMSIAGLIRQLAAGQSIDESLKTEFSITGMPDLIEKWKQWIGGKA